LKNKQLSIFVLPSSKFLRQFNALKRDSQDLFEKFFIFIYHN